MRNDFAEEMDTDEPDEDGNKLGDGATPARNGSKGGSPSPLAESPRCAVKIWYEKDTKLSDAVASWKTWYEKITKDFAEVIMTMKEARAEVTLDISGDVANELAIFNQRLIALRLVTAQPKKIDKIVMSSTASEILSPLTAVALENHTAKQDSVVENLVPADSKPEAKKKRIQTSRGKGGDADEEKRAGETSESEEETVVAIAIIASEEKKDDVETTKSTEGEKTSDGSGFAVEVSVGVAPAPVTQSLVTVFRVPMDNIDSASDVSFFCWCLLVIAPAQHCGSTSHSVHPKLTQAASPVAGIGWVLHRRAKVAMLYCLSTSPRQTRSKLWMPHRQWL